MRIEKMKEIAVLPVKEKAILDMAYEILSDIADDCEDTDDLYTYASDAANELESFLLHGKNNFYRVEEPSSGTVTIEITVK